MFAKLTCRHRLAKNLYNSSARFVFELLQNTDDNSYSKARSLSAVPFVSFHVYHRRIVVECNEDGFTQENLKAICDVGKSSKTGTQGYIGEKGIGFKSVFMVAWKVHIKVGRFLVLFPAQNGRLRNGNDIPHLGKYRGTSGSSTDSSSDLHYCFPS